MRWTLQQACILVSTPNQSLLSGEAITGMSVASFTAKGNDQEQPKITWEAFLRRCGAAGLRLEPTLLAGPRGGLLGAAAADGGRSFMMACTSEHFRVPTSRAVRQTSPLYRFLPYSTASSCTAFSCPHALSLIEDAK